tara:strand:+ start:4866 stop:5654 length:789 start_codon:yes stop_codon:yes gene_type:complete
MDDETKREITQFVEWKISQNMDGIKAGWGVDESMKEFNTALSKVQGALKGALKDSENPFHKNSYADLESIWNSVRQHLADNGFSVTQTPDAEGTRLVTVLSHSSGAWRRGTWNLNTVKKDPQGYMASITYARRGGLASMLGVHQTDDDGNEASGISEDDIKEAKNKKTQTKPKVKMPKAKDDFSIAGQSVKETAEMFRGKEIELLNGDKAKGLQDRLNKLTEFARAEFKKEFKHESIERLEKKLYSKVTKFISRLEKKAKAA